MKQNLKKSSQRRMIFQQKIDQAIKCVTKTQQTKKMGGD